MCGKDCIGLDYFIEFTQKIFKETKIPQILSYHSFPEELEFGGKLQVISQQLQFLEIYRKGAGNFNQKKIASDLTEPSIRNSVS